MKPQVTTTTHEIIEKVTETSFNIGTFSVVFTETVRQGVAKKSFTIKHIPTDKKYFAILVKPSELETVKQIGFSSLGNPFNINSKDSRIEKVEKESTTIRNRQREQERNTDLFFQCLTGENTEFIMVLISSYDHTMFVVPENKFYRSLFFDYIDAGLNNENFNLEKVLESLKKSEDNNLFLISERVESIPGYNRTKECSERLEFFYLLEVSAEENISSHELYFSVYKKLGLTKFLKKNNDFKNLI